MPLLVRNVQSIPQVNHILRGGITFPMPYKGDERVFGLHNLTLVFTAPSTTVTFQDAGNDGLYMREILSRVATGSSNALKAQLHNGLFHIIQPTPSAAVALNVAGSTAAAIFRLSGSTLVGTFYAPPDGTAPRLISITGSEQGDSIVLVTEEA